MLSENAVLTALNVREDKKKEVFVEGLSEYIITS